MKLNRKSTLALLGVASLFSSLVLGSTAHAANTPTRYLSLSATGTVKVIPDAVRLNATVSVLADSNKSALSQTANAAAAVRATLVKYQIAQKWIKTSSVSVYPEYNWTQDKGSVLTGYRASQSFDVTILTTANAGAIVDAVVAAGGDAIRIDGVSPFVMNPDVGIEAAQAAAVKKARAKATAYAKLLGVKLGPVIYMEEASAPTPGPIYLAGMTAKADSSAPTVIDVGQQDVTVSINIRFYLS